MAEIKLGFTPFKEAVEYLRDKTAVGSDAYTDLLHEMHDKAFVIAGVTKAQIASQVQDSLVEAMEKGLPFEQWKKGVGQKMGWDWLPPLSTGEQNTGWRARTIYQTNMRTAYAAGRYQQMERIKKTHPYWRYRHGDSRVPRKEHQAWEGVVLPADDQWWDTHYPPNGWGCTCYVEPVSRAEYEEECKKNGKPKRPAYEDGDPKTEGFGDRVLKVPVGIDKGWAYPPGGGGDQGLLRALAQSHPKYSAQAWDDIKDKALKREAERMKGPVEAIIKRMEGKAAGKTLKEAREMHKHNNAWVVHFIDANTQAKAEKESKGKFKLPSAGVELTSWDVEHAWSEDHKKADILPPMADYLRMPELLANPKAVYYDTDNNTLVYAYQPSPPIKNARGKNMLGIFVVHIDEQNAAIRARNNKFKKNNQRTLCKVRTAYLRTEAGLKNVARFVLVK